MNKIIFVRREMAPDEPPPLNESGVFTWIYRNLFSSIPNTLLTLLSFYILYTIITPLLQFGVFNAVWFGSSRADCTTINQGGNLENSSFFGACWPYIFSYINQFIYGRYPIDQYWRVNVVYLIFTVSMITMLIPAVPFKRINVLFLFGIFPVIAFILLTGGNIDLNGFILPNSWVEPSMGKFLIDFLIIMIGVLLITWGICKGTHSNVMASISKLLVGFCIALVVLLVCSIDFGLSNVETDVWGGLLVTLVIAVTGIVASLPIGIALALGRRSSMPIIRLTSIIFIEFWRGVPLITVLFMSSVMLPLFLPDGVTFDKLLRALIGVALFSSAYIAEVVRGGIQALPRGQYEGAASLGLGYWKMMRMIILPQALKLVIPGIVNSFIALFKDTTLIMIIGLFDFLGTIQSSFSDPAWASPVQSLTGYLFAAVIYWIFCFIMSRYSLYIERRLDTGY